MKIFKENKEKIAAISIGANSFLAIAKTIIGIISNSGVVLADGLHSLVDVFSSLITYIGIRVSRKPEDEKHPYGHYKFETLTGFLITLFLLGTGVFIIYGAYQKFLNPVLNKLPFLTLGVMFFSAVVNYLMSRLEFKFGKKENSAALLANGTHDSLDTYTSLAIFIGLFLTPYWIYFDSLLALLVGLFIIKESFSLARETLDSLLDVSAGPEIEKQIKLIVEEEQVQISSLKTQKKGSSLTANIEINLDKNLKVEEANKISDNLRAKLMNKIKNLSYIAIQIKSHELETGSYKPNFGQKLSWHRRGRFKNKTNEKLKGFPENSKMGQGPQGFCVCPHCDYKTKHQLGVPCPTLKCPQCGSTLVRK